MQNTYKLPTPKQKDIEVDISIRDACNFRVKGSKNFCLTLNMHAIDDIISELLGLLGSI